MMEDQEKDDQDDLVEELTPTLHQERAGDFATTMQTILLGGYFSGSNGVLHARCRSHGVLAANPDTVEEESPHIADDPAVLRNAPCCSKHDKTNEHDRRILNQTPSTAYPVTNEADQNLTNDDTTDLEIVDCLSPRLVANLVAFPTRGESGLQKWSYIANGEEDVSTLN